MQCIMATLLLCGRDKGISFFKIGILWSFAIVSEDIIFFKLINILNQI